MSNKHTIVIAVLCLVLGGCSFIDESPHSALTEQEAFASMSALKQNAVLSVYHYIGGDCDSEGLHGTGRGVYDLNSLTTDEQIIPTRGGDWYDGGYWNRLRLHTWTTDDSSIRDTWDYLFKVVMLCVTGMERIDGYHLADANRAELSKLRAELQALKAMYYFYLVDLYGSVPIVTRSTVRSDSLHLATRAEVFRYAVSELQAAMPLLAVDQAQHPSSEYYGRMTYYVAQFTLMKLYLNHAVYTGAENTALYDSVLVCADRISTAYRLAPMLADNFALNNENSEENIFTIPREAGLYRAHYNYFHRSAHYNHAAALGMGGENGASATLQTLQVFGYATAEQDPRFEQYFYYDTVYCNGTVVYAEDGVSPLVYHADKIQPDLTGSPYEKNAGARLRKYEHDPNGLHDATVGKNDIVLFRYADVLLMKAEALTRLGRDGKNEVNEVRNRVGAQPLTTAPTLDDIYYERWRELMWEGWHRNDMIRMGKWTGYTTLFPIPAELITMHPGWKQNPGYTQ